MNLDFLKPKAPPLIGLDISSSAVKMVELSQAGRNFSLERYVIEPLPKDAVTDNNIVNSEAVAHAIRNAWRRMGSKVKNVAAALPASAVITKKILVQAGMSERELESQVETEANQYIPFSLDEVNLDFQVLGIAANNPDEEDVLIAAAKKDKVDERVAAIEEAGLKAVVLDVESYATQAAFELMRPQLPNGGENQIVAVVDIGSTAMHMNIFKDGQSIYSRDQGYAGNQLTQEIQRKFNMSAEEAEQAKRQGGLPDNYEPDVLQPFMDTMALEISRSLQFFYTSSNYNAVDHILLAGGCSVIHGLDEAVSSRTQVASTMRANPFFSMSTGKIKGKQIQLDAPSLLIACGLAMRRFDPV
ncbi:MULTISPECIES: pilus assembly protein PilM [Deefgea]|uniref:Pilus assembly protein PilM n=1 Tax=Deefgea piscis TaxID=2739061 RepID=A0A6M8STE5_9NEIS|nr:MULTISPECIES: pilus assembly protein PilM [Deefgea]MBM5574718.1 type IV pilus assembly protein PilM [Deefgea sp. CFH1-16]QKJ66696.1 pilus assembly protein PilM [Deefgea piscis]QZA81859.1 pilus assembly protein PilM [Deefgea piscis]